MIDWISVAERLPPEMTKEDLSRDRVVITLDSKGKVREGFLVKGREGLLVKAVLFFLAEEDYAYLSKASANITHWAEINKPEV